MVEYNAYIWANFQTFLHCEPVDPALIEPPTYHHSRDYIDASFSLGNKRIPQLLLRESFTLINVVFYSSCLHLIVLNVVHRETEFKNKQTINSENGNDMFNGLP